MSPPETDRRPVAAPRPPKRRPNALTPARSRRYQPRLPHVQHLRSQVFRLDQLLVGGRGPVRHRRPGHEPAAGGRPHDGACQPRAGDRDSGGVPVGHPLHALLNAEIFRGRPDSRELVSGHSEVAYRDARDVVLGDLHAFQGRTGHRQFASSKQVTGPHVRSRRGFALRAARAVERPCSTAFGGAWRPLAYHGLTHRQGRSALLRVATRRPPAALDREPPRPRWTALRRRGTQRPATPRGRATRPNNTGRPP